jgi:hypothetical protein
MQDEERGEGHISKEDIKRYLDALGSRWWFLGLFLASSVERVLYVGTGTSVAQRYVHAAIAFTQHHGA